jgi:hypothetical protein
MSSGYSGTPLIKKLGIKEGFKARFISPPENHVDLLGPFPEGLIVLKNNKTLANFIHLFCEDLASFNKQFVKIKDEIEKDGIIWVSWYKKSAKIPTDLNEDVIRNTALSLGLVDVKVCAVDEKWSALKIVWRKENR